VEEFHCPECGQSAFSTVCSNCQAEGIRIRKVQRAFHVGRCQRCGHLDDEPCGVHGTLDRSFSRALRSARRTLAELGSRALRLAARAAEAIRGGTVRTR
jgi:hypothetical protein